MKTKHVIMLGVTMAASWCAAQLPNALDVTASIALVDSDGKVLPGNNPLSASGHVPGCLVQLIDVGANGKVDLPQAAGVPGGDDRVLAVAHVGEGMLVPLRQSGRFTFSVVPAPAKGTRVYVRVFNHRDAAQATNWGQSALFTVNGSQVLNVGALGLSRTNVPVGTDPAGTDTDGDGVTDLDELIANTNARDGVESFGLPGLAADGSVTINGVAGRNYRLWRATSLTEGPWVAIDASGILVTSRVVKLRDASPPAGRAYYRLTVTFPDLN